MLKRVTSREKLKYDNVYAVDTLQPDVKAPRDGGRSVAQAQRTKEGDQCECRMCETVKRLRSRPRPMPQATLIKRERRTRRSRRSLVVRVERQRVPLTGVRTTVTTYVFGEASGREHMSERTRDPDRRGESQTVTLLSRQRQHCSHTHSHRVARTQCDRKRHVA